MYNVIKRFFDITMSFIALIILFPFFILIGILVKITSRGPIFYKHERVGKNGKLFNVHKFRTMKYDPRPLKEQLTKEQYEEFLINYKLKNDPRLTKFGKILRKTSMDELPQLWDILIGKMSFVGPRPLVEDEISRLTEDERKKYLSVIPGLTGFWASHGRSTLTYQKRIDLEIFYVEHKSLYIDFKILVKTCFVFFKNAE